MRVKVGLKVIGSRNNIWKGPCVIVELLNGLVCSFIVVGQNKQVRLFSIKRGSTNT
jgi:hypothetical protein